MKILFGGQQFYGRGQMPPFPTPPPNEALYSAKVLVGLSTTLCQDYGGAEDSTGGIFKLTKLSRTLGHKERERGKDMISL